MVAAPLQQAGVLIRDGACTQHTCITPQQLLEGTQNGAYTTALLVDGWQVVMWDMHVERLIR